MIFDSEHDVFHYLALRFVKGKVQEEAIAQKEAEEATAEESANIGLIIAIAGGVVILIGIIVLVIFLKRKNDFKKANETNKS